MLLVIVWDFFLGVVRFGCIGEILCCVGLFLHYEVWWCLNNENLSEKKIKANFIVSETTLCTQNFQFCMQKKNFRKKFFFAYEIRFAV